MRNTLERGMTTTEENNESEKQIKDLRKYFGEDVDVDYLSDEICMVRNNIEISGDRTDDGQPLELKTELMLGYIEETGTWAVVNKEASKIVVRDKECLLSDILPEDDTYLQFSDDENKFRHYVDQEVMDYVNLDSLSSVEDFSTFLHEVGHAYLSYKGPKIDRLTGSEINMIATGEYGDGLPYDNDELYERLERAMEDERNCWAWAIKQASKFGLPLKKEILAEAEKSLATYDIAAFKLKTDSQPIASEHLASSELRRKSGDQEEIEKMDLVIFIRRQFNDLRSEIRSKAPLESYEGELEIVLEGDAHIFISEGNDLSLQYVRSVKYRDVKELTVFSVLMRNFDSVSVIAYVETVVDEDSDNPKIVRQVDLSQEFDLRSKEKKPVKELEQIKSNMMGLVGNIRRSNFTVEQKYPNSWKVHPVTGQKLKPADKLRLVAT